MSAQLKEIVEKVVTVVKVPYTDEVKKMWGRYENMVPFSALELWGMVSSVLESRTARRHNLSLYEVYGPAGNVLTHYRDLLAVAVDRNPDWIVGSHYVERLGDVLQLCRLYVVAHSDDSDLAERLLGEIDTAMWNIAPGVEFNKYTPKIYSVAGETIGDWTKYKSFRVTGNTWEEYFETDGSVEDELERSIFPTFRFGKKPVKTFVDSFTSPHPEVVAYNREVGPQQKSFPEQPDTLQPKKPKTFGRLLSLKKQG